MELHFPQITNNLTEAKQRRPNPAKKLMTIIAIVIAAGASVIGVVT